jgi:O-antigen/teichoic acid export membrane protein
MGIVFRQSVKTTFVVAAGAILGALTIWLSTKYIPNKQLFGFTKTLTNQAVILSQLFIMGLGSTLSVYIHKYTGQKAKLVITFTLLLPIVFIAIGTLIYFALQKTVLHHYQPDDAPLMEHFYCWLPVYTLLFTCMTMLELYLGSQLKVAVAAFMREVVVRVLSIALLLAYAFVPGIVTFDVFVVGTVLIYLIPVVLFILLAYRTEAFGFSANFRLFSFSEYGEMLHFTWYHFLMTLSLSLLAFMDALLIPFYDHSGLSAGAVYAVAVFIISFLQIPVKALMPASYAVIAKAFADEQHDLARDYFVRASINMLIPTVFLALIICCNLHNAVAVIKNGYDEIVPVFNVLLIGRLVDCATGMNDQVLSITNYYKFNFYVSFVLIIVLFILIRILVPMYGIIGAAWSTTLTITIFNAVKYVFVWKKLNMQPFSKNTLLVIIAGAAAFLPGYFVPRINNPFADTMLRCIIITAAYGILLVVLKPSADLRTYIGNIKKDKRLF